MSAAHEENTGRHLDFSTVTTRRQRLVRAAKKNKETQEFEAEIESGIIPDVVPPDDIPSYLRAVHKVATGRAKRARETERKGIRRLKRVSTSFMPAPSSESPEKETDS